VTRLPPLAARAVMRAAIEDRVRDGVTDPTVLAQAAARALADAGWTIAPTGTLPGRQTGTHAAA
jgi:hypothetical protein